MVTPQLNHLCLHFFHYYSVLSFQRFLDYPKDKILDLYTLLGKGENNEIRTSLEKLPVMLIKSLYPPATSIGVTR